MSGVVKRVMLKPLIVVQFDLQQAHTTLKSISAMVCIVLLCISLNCIVSHCYGVNNTSLQDHFAAHSRQQRLIDKLTIQEKALCRYIMPIHYNVRQPRLILLRTIVGWHANNAFIEHGQYNTKAYYTILYYRKQYILYLATASSLKGKAVWISVASHIAQIIAAVWEYYTILYTASFPTWQVAFALTTSYYYYVSSADNIALNEFVNNWYMLFGN